MRISPLVSGVAAVSLGAASLGLTGWDALSARRDAGLARAEQERAQRQATELRRLIAGGAAGILEATPAPELPQRVTQALASCGLPPSALESFSGDPARQHSDGPVRRRATMALGAVTLPQVGKFLEAWRTLEPGWIVDSIELAPAGEAPEGVGGGDLPLRAVIGIECIVPDGGGTG